MENQQVDKKIQYGEFFDRAIAHIIDNIILFAVNFVISFSIVYVLKAYNTMSSHLYLYATIPVVLLYYGFMESSQYQATVGKLILGLKVTNLNFERLSFLKAAERCFILTLPSLLFALFHFKMLWGVVGFLLIVMPAALTAKNQGIHDIMSKCIIVKKECLEVPMAIDC